jgi:heme/copper-type cytochrome/quinol oxidase subunit 1
MQISADIELSNLQGPVRRTTTIEKPSWARRQFTGWRFGVLSGVLLAMTVLVLNLVITLQAMKWKSGNNNSPTDDDGLRLLFEGDCKQASQLNVLAHLLINAMSTVLLSASNYGMQVLSAPTRSEVDSAHARRRWLDIGVLSVRNIKSINQKRAWMWGLLGASSLPLHLL